MGLAKEVAYRLRALLRRAAVESELDEELRAHLEREADELIAAGVAPEEARRQARLRLEGLEQAKERCREARGLAPLEAAGRDLRQALRSWRRSPAWTAVVLLTLALGIGANTAIFSAMDAVLVAALPVAQPQQLSLLESGSAGAAGPRFSAPFLRALRAGGGPAPIAAFTRAVPLYQTRAGEPPRAIDTQLVSGNFFSVLGIRPARGRLLAAEDDQAPDGRAVAVLAYRYWGREFGYDPGVLGRTLVVNGVGLEIVGVAPAGFYGLDKGGAASLWVPERLQYRLHYAYNADSDSDRGPSDRTRPWAEESGIRWLHLIARAPDAASRGELAAAATAVDRRQLAPYVGHADPDEAAAMRRETVWLVPGARGLGGLGEQLRPALETLLGMAGLLLLVACASVALLLLARGLARQQETAVRLAIGAGGGAVARQLVVEGLLLALAGGGLGLLVAVWGRGALLAWLGADLPQAALHLDPRVLGFALGVALATGIVFGLAPARGASRVDLAAALKQDAPTATGGALAAWPVVAQVAFSLVLLVAAALFVRTLATLTARDPGFARRSTLAATVNVRAAGIAAGDLRAFDQRLVASVGALPGVEAAGLAYCGVVAGCRHTSGFVIAAGGGRAAITTEIQEDTVSPGFFRATGMHLVRGRLFGDGDGPKAAPVVVVNQAFARRYLSGRDPLGATLGYDAGDAAHWRIVGVIADARVNGLDRAAPPLVYKSSLQDPMPARLDARFMAVQFAGNATSGINALRKRLAAVAPSMPVGDIRTLGEQADRGLAGERAIARLALIFAGLATLLAALALYGVLAHAVTRRSREIGLRLALGAGRGEVFGLVLGQAARWVALGLGIGLAAALAAAQLLRGFLYGLSPADPAAVAAGTLALAAVGLAAALVPARRAARLDPWRALRQP